MADSRRRNPTLLLLLATLAIGAVVVFAVTSLDLPRARVTVGAVVLGVLLVVGALALPALILSGWQSENE
ncbi:hypothetical protein [Natrinema gelatinilyticum]|uniref:hypothetical protein n=1 Tax=Natrinema gelatinilyticum TaxID=2961571 RepID=UPI0020C595FD|nr:hypothetical protein [Natrinema gelatinilyticum]